MIPLPRYFRCGGFDTKVILREGRIALLEKSKPGGTESYEVVVIQHRPAEIVFGKEHPARESMPCSESWGQEGWTYKDRQSAEKKFFLVLRNSRFSGKGHAPNASKEAARV